MHRLHEIRRNTQDINTQDLNIFFTFLAKAHIIQHSIFDGVTFTFPPELLLLVSRHPLRILLISHIIENKNCIFLKFDKLVCVRNQILFPFLRTCEIVLFSRLCEVLLTM